MVVINGYVTNVNLTANTPTQIAKISGVSLPSAVLRTVCGVAINAYNHPADIAYLAINGSGEISITSDTTGTRAVYFSASYIV